MQLYHQDPHTRQTIPTSLQKNENENENETLKQPNTNIYTLGKQICGHGRRKA